MFSCVIAITARDVFTLLALSVVNALSLWLRFELLIEQRAEVGIVTIVVTRQMLGCFYSG